MPKFWTGGTSGSPDGNIVNNVMSRMLLWEQGMHECVLNYHILSRIGCSETI